MAPNQPGVCSAPSCELPPVLQWQRWASDQEYAAIPANHQTGSATIAVFACASHALAPDTSSFVHQSGCTWPAPCGCTAQQDAAPEQT
jgi:hypothetical protein